jgi:hypothetical protein
MDLVISIAQARGDDLFSQPDTQRESAPSDNSPSTAMERFALDPRVMSMRPW